MGNSLRSKLILSYLSIALLTAALIFFFIRFTSTQRLKALVLEQQVNELQLEMILWYETKGSWDGFETYYIALNPPPAGQPGPTAGAPIQGKHGVIDAEKRVLIPYRSHQIGEIIPDRLIDGATAVVVAGKTVGWVVPDDFVGVVLNQEQQQFLEFTNRALLIAGAIAVAVALLTALILSRLIIRPISALTEASERMAEGDLKQEVTTHSRDEIGRLTASFNSMSQQVALSNERRRHLTAAVAHDLGTPLHIISGYVEMIQEETLDPTPKRMGIIATELAQLGHLIQDLDTLALTDTNRLETHLEPVALENYLPRFVDSFHPTASAKSIALTLDIQAESVPLVQVDQERMAQVLGNLLSNALRYTPEGREIWVVLKTADDRVQIEVSDNGIGIPAEELPFVFDRFYQVDKSRAERGKMGLGLTISKGLVEAMGGEISVDSQGEHCGSTFKVILPCITGP